MKNLMKMGQSINRFMVSNVSKKTFKYSFETGVSTKQHPRRTGLNGTDKIFVSEHLILLADHGHMEK